MRSTGKKDWRLSSWKFSMARRSGTALSEHGDRVHCPARGGHVGRHRWQRAEAELEATAALAVVAVVVAALPPAGAASTMAEAGSPPTVCASPAFNA